MLKLKALALIVAVSLTMFVAKLAEQVDRLWRQLLGDDTNLGRHRTRIPTVAGTTQAGADVEPAFVWGADVWPATVITVVGRR